MFFILLFILLSVFLLHNLVYTKYVMQQVVVQCTCSIRFDLPVSLKLYPAGLGGGQANTPPPPPPPPNRLYHPLPPTPSLEHAQPHFSPNCKNLNYTLNQRKFFWAIKFIIYVITVHNSHAVYNVYLYLQHQQLLHTQHQQLQHYCTCSTCIHHSTST